MRAPISLFFTLLAAAAVARAEVRPVDVSPLCQWLAQQREIRTLAADFTQTRRLQALRDPVTRPGRLWFRVPGAFRWELGAPPELIVLRDRGPVTVVSVRRKTARRFDPAALAAGAGARDLPFLEFPLAADYEAFRQRFTLLDLRADADHCEFAMLPRDPEAARALREIRVVFDRRTGQLRSFEVTARDGSVLRNDFTNVRVNLPLPADSFAFDLTGYRVTDEN